MWESGPNAIKSVNDILPTESLVITVAPMGSQQSRPQTPEIQFRVLIIGRANAGKTAILQRVCETTDSPIVYRGKEEVRRPTILSANLVSFPTQVKLDPSMGVSDRGTSH